MQNNQNERSAALVMLQSINRVEGFDPAPLAVEYTDMNNNEKRWRLPVRVQMGWFRLRYPESKIAVVPKAVNEYFVSHARVYAHYNDLPESFLAEGTAARGKDPGKPTVSPREWSQTAAIGIALNNAGFGLHFDAAGDAFDHHAVDELGFSDIQFTGGNTASMQPAPTPQPHTTPDETLPPAVNAPEAMPAAPFEVTPPVHQPTPPPMPSPAAEVQQPTDFDAAMSMPCPIKQHAGKTLGQVLREDPGCISWLANSYKKDPGIAAAAQLICDYALSEAS